MIRKPFIGPAALALLGGTTLSPFLAAAPLTLDEQVVTATRSERPVRASLAATTVIDREQIERTQARSVPELLRSVPGVTLSNNGGPGKNTTLFMRGTESRLQAKVTNLLDADYETALDYNQPGQAVFFTVRYQAL